jgi:hypothetical protein
MGVVSSLCSDQNCSSMYGYKFTYNSKDIRNYRYIIYNDVQFKKTINYHDSRKILKGVVYPFLINDINNGNFLFTDEYLNPLICSYPMKNSPNRHSIDTDIVHIINIFKDFFDQRDTPKIICSGFSFDYQSHQ